MADFRTPRASPSPGVPESDLSGTIVEVSDSSRFKVGDEVFGWIPADLCFKTGRGGTSLRVRGGRAGGRAEAELTVVRAK